MRVLITGVSGMLGAAVALELAGNHSVVGCYNAAPVQHPSFDTFACNLSDGSALTRLTDLNPDAIVHCAASTNVDWCESHPETARQTNVEGTRTVTRAAAATGARLIAISTDAVFAGTGPFGELDQTNPLNVYARTKLEAEHVALSLGSQSLVIRTNIYGFNAQSKSSLAEWILDSLRAGTAINGFTDARFTPLLANDLAAAVRRLLEDSSDGGRTISGVLHLAGSEASSKYDFAVSIAREFGLDDSLVRPSTMAEAGLTAQRSPDLSLDCSRALALGLDLPDVASGLSRFHDRERSGYPNVLLSMIA